MTQIHYNTSRNKHQVIIHKNTDEYILKLQIHQHSLLTRKVFSQHNFHHWSSSLGLLIIYIFNSSLSSSLLCLQVIFVSESGSSLDLDHLCSIISRSGSSLDLDHLYWIIITESSQVLSHDSSHHRKFYRAIPFHAGCRPSHHVGLRPALTSDHVGTNL